MIGVISDIHANKAALEAVLDDMPSVDALVCCGDIVGYGPDPRECVDTVMEVCDVAVQGNHDRHITSPTTYSNPLAVEGLRHAQQQLYQEHFNWLLSLPVFTRESGYSATHSHPEADERRIASEQAVEAFDEYIRPEDTAIFVGHTHVQYASQSEAGWTVINPGSVGQPRDDDLRAAYALYAPGTGEVELRRVSYDVTETVRRMKEADLPEGAWKRLQDAT